MGKDEEGIDKKDIAEVILEAKQACKDVKFKSDRERCMTAYITGRARGNNAQKKKRLKDMSVKEILRTVWET